MSTQDSASVTTKCGDERDDLLQEYRTYNVPSQNITCSSFTTGHSTPYFTVDILKRACGSQPTEEFPWILQSEEYLAMITAWYAQITFPVNSTYRDPYQNKLCGGVMPPVYPLSRHMYGDAMDAGNPSHNPDDWQKLRDAAVLAYSDWQEDPIGPCKMGCVHADMRYHGPTYIF